MALLDDSGVGNSWEECIEESSNILDKQLERLRLEKSKREHVEDNSTASIVLDSTTQDSLRTQYVPPEPKMTILMRPKEPRNAHVQSSLESKSKNVPSKKTLQQREQEYTEARMRILGDVRFEAEEAEAEMEAILSPAEILKLKIAEAMMGDESIAPASRTPMSNGVKGPSSSGAESVSSSSIDANSGTSAGTGHSAPSRGGRHKRSREKIKTTNPEPKTRDFPVHKTDLERIIRHPRGPDGSTGFNIKRT